MSEDKKYKEKEEQEAEERALDRKSSAQEKYNIKGWLMSVLRRASFRWGPRAECLRNARKERGKYECAMCKQLFSLSKKEIKADHIEPVIPLVGGYPFRPNGRPDWNVIIDRMMVDLSGWQALCNTCHDAKTMQEDTIRAHFNQERKKLAREKLKKEKEDARKTKATPTKT